MLFVCFFDPSEVRDRELILMVHSTSEVHEILAFSYHCLIFFSSELMIYELADTVLCCAQGVRPVRRHLCPTEILPWIHTDLSLQQLARQIMQCLWSHWNWQPRFLSVMSGETWLTGAFFGKHNLFFVCFFDPSEVRDRELILMVHSGSKRSMKCWHSLIAASSFIFSQSWYFEHLRTLFYAVPKL